jgi:hypothetical protein
MTKVVIDASLRSQLRDVGDVLEVCDESGHTLGYFHPVLPPAADADREVASPLSDEEIGRRQQRPGGRPLSEIMADLNRS